MPETNEYFLFAGAVVSSLLRVNISATDCEFTRPTAVMTSIRFHDDTERVAFCERLEKLWLYKTLCDVKIKCQSYKATAHSHVLAAQAFTSGFVETEAKDIVLQKDAPAVIEAMLRHPRI
ncbi:hypothetical protein AC579_4646 [Pseudocercospora musae]|uniref:BTB domain-containing protein n=1 Tax=Pseudocercospora musae TaxID=113226 RepID=A0A139IBH1_9PEZI|nr:hypothetical protein AC579_4646 [Pseudocercospora musae]